MATRFLPGRLVGARLLAPRIKGAASAAVGQTATHLALTTQPGGAVSGLPLTIQPIGQALDLLDTLVPGFGGTITATVSSGTATIVAGGSAPTVNGAFAFADLTLVGPAGLVTITFSSSPLTPVTSVTFLLEAAAAAFFWVTGPTRLSKLRHSLKQGDTEPARRTQLLGADGTPQQLPAGTTVRYTLRGPDGNVIRRRGACTIETANGEVRYDYQPTDTAEFGLCTDEFEVTGPAPDHSDEVLTFPNNTDGIVKIRPQLA